MTHSRHSLPLHTWSLILALLTALGMLPTTASAQAVSCLADTALVHAIEYNNPQLRAARSANRALMADLRAENRPGQTSIEYSPFYQSGYEGVASSELIVQQEFNFPTLYAARSRQAHAQQSQLDLQYRVLRRDILLEATQLSIDLQAAQAMRQLLGLRLSAADTLFMAYQRRLDEGDATLIDVNRIKMDRMSVTTEALRCDAQLASLTHDLERLNGGRPLPRLSASLMDAPLTEANTDETSSLESRLAAASVATARRELSVAQQSWLPDLTLGYRRNTEQAESLHGFLVGVSVPLFGNGQRVKAARLRRTAAEEQLLTVQAEQTARQLSLLDQARQLRLMLQAYDEPLMHQQLTLLRHAVMAGELSVIAYYAEADRIYTLLQERLSTLCEYRKTLASLRREQLFGQ